MAFTKIVAAGINTGGSYTLQELNTVGVMTAGTVQVGSATTVHTTGIDLGSGNITSHNINSTGIITATSFVGSLTAPLGSVTATNGTFSTNLLALTKIGIGTDDPESGKSLHVFGDTNDTNVKIEATASGKDARLELIANSTGVSQIRLGDEASANPGTITYDHSNNSLSFRTNGTSDRLRITSGGLVGIGTDNPSGKLNIVGSDTQLLNLIQDSGDLAIRLNDRGTGSAYIKVPDNTSGSLTFETGGSERLRITSSGNIGIGTDNPDRHFHVEGTDNIQGKFENNAAICMIEFQDSNTTAGNRPSYGAVGNNGVIYAGGGERLRITSGGYVGINETSPVHHLSIGINTSTAWDSTKNVSNTTNNDFIGLSLTNKNTGDNPEIGVMFQAGPSSAGQYTINCLRTGSSTADLIFRTRDGGSASKEQLRVKSDGQININASSESAGGRVLIKHNVDYTTTDFDDSPTLYLLNDDRTTGVSESAIVFAGRNSGGSTFRAAISGNGSTGLKFYTTNNAESDDTPAMIIGGSGNIGVGTDNPSHKLDVVGNTQLFGTVVVGASNDISPSSTGTGQLQIDADGYTSYIACDATAVHIGHNSGLRDLKLQTNETDRLTITPSGSVGINSAIPGSLVDIVGQTSEDAILNIRSYDKDSAIKLWPSDDHDPDRWRMAFWENDSDTLGNDYPDWMVDGHGRQWITNNLYMGRSRTFGDSPGNQFRYYGNSGPGIFIYNGVDGDSTNYSAYFGLRCYQTDTDDRNILYYTAAGTTATLDYDAHQYFGVKATGRVQGKHQFFSGRVESDEGTPNSVYYAGRGGYYAYDTTSTAVVYLLAEAGGSTSTYFAFARTSDNDTQWKHRTSDGRMYVDASATTFNGADYAEYFEWSDGNTNNEDRAGYTVVLKNGNKIGIATAGDSPSSIIGVISGVPAIIGDGQDLSWQGKWLKDEFGREITTDVQYLVWNRGYEKDENGNKVPVAQPNPDDQMSMQGADQQIEVGSKLDAAIAEGNVPQFAIDNNIRMTGQRRVKNPDYNPDAIYVPREFRPEWSPVGLVGKLIVRKGQVMGDRWIKMKDINEQLEQWLVR